VRPHGSEPTRHQVQVGTGEHQVRQRLVVAVDEREQVGMGSGQLVQVRSQAGIARAEDRQAHRDLGEQRYERGQQVDALLVSQAGDDGGESDAVVDEPDPFVQRATVGGASIDRRRRERCGDQGVLGRIPHLGVDPVEDADKVVGTVTQWFVEAEAALGGDDLVRVVR
jgi:hypothetical protein